MKILILVLSLNDGGIYDKFYESQKKTWDSEKIDGVETLYYFGNSGINSHRFMDENDIIDGNEILVNVGESHLGHKTIRAFNLIKELDFDYIFRTNSSSYVDKKMLLEYVKTKPKFNYYSGVIGNHHGIKFSSGCGYILSKDLLNLVLNQKNNWNHNLVDDVAMGKLLYDNNINPSFNERFDVSDGTGIPMNFFHYRLKNHDRNFDIETMYNIKKLKDEYNNR